MCGCLLQLERAEHMRRRVALERELRVLRRGGQGGEATPGDDTSDVSVDSLDGGDSADGSGAAVRASTLM